VAQAYATDSCSFLSFSDSCAKLIILSPKSQARNVVRAVEKAFGSKHLDTKEYEMRSGVDQKEKL